MYKNKVIGIIIIAIALTYIHMGTGFALKNPHAAYCEQMGYELIVEKSEIGEIDICKFSETENCIAWEFLTGKCGTEHSYCVKEGYQLKNVSDPEKCTAIPFTTDCALCVLENGTEIEVSELMGLILEEGICGDGSCVLGENYLSCPVDCSSGSKDGYCDGIHDNRCDPDCAIENDNDCQITNICGDGICHRNENHISCSQDCPSGLEDDFCDEIKDGICDPDCSKNEDIDCKSTWLAAYIFFALAIIILIIALFAYKKVQDKKKWTELEKKMSETYRQ